MVQNLTETIKSSCGQTSHIISVIYNLPGIQKIGSGMIRYNKSLFLVVSAISSIIYGEVLLSPCSLSRLVCQVHNDIPWGWHVQGDPKQTSKVVFPSSQHFYAFLMKNISPETNWNRCSLFQLGMHASPPYSSRTPPPSQAVPYARALEASPWLPCENGFGGETRRASLGWLKWFEIVILGRNPNLKYPKQTQLIFSGTCWMIPIKKWIESSPWTYFWVSCHFF